MCVKNCWRLLATNPGEIFHCVKSFVPSCIMMILPSRRDFLVCIFIITHKFYIYVCIKRTLSAGVTQIMMQSTSGIDYYSIYFGGKSDCVRRIRRSCVMQLRTSAVISADTLSLIAQGIQSLMVAIILRLKPIYFIYFKRYGVIRNSFSFLLLI